MADIYGALADATRRAILDELVERDGQTLFEICAQACDFGLNDPVLDEVFGWPGMGVHLSGHNVLGVPAAVDAICRRIPYD